MGRQLMLPQSEEAEKYLLSYLIQTPEAIDDLSNGNEKNINPEINFKKIDLATNDIFSKLNEYKFNAIIHCAAQSSNALSFVDIKKDIDSNLLSTYNLLEFCKSNNIDLGSCLWY